MTFDEYQERAIETAIYKDTLYPFLGLAEEAGEVCGKMAKHVRDKIPLQRWEIAKELGDVLWMVANIANDMGYDLSFIALMNLDKLKDRQQRNVISGSGDDR